MKIKWTFFLLLLSFKMIAQSEKQNIKVITNAEPFFPKGDNALYQHVLMNIHYSEDAKKKYIVGEVMLGFDVKPDSCVTNVIVISGVGYGIDEEVKRLVQTLKFAPGIQNGTVVKMNTMYTFPVKAH